MSPKTTEAILRAIREFQATFVATGDVRLIRPMIALDVAERAGVDRATVSRVRSARPAHRVCGLTLAELFTGKRTRGPSTSAIALRELVRDALRQHDESDVVIAARVRVEHHVAVSRRMVAKIRKQLGIPNSHVRKKEETK